MKYGELIDRQDVSDTNVGDTISRQAAIRWVKTECNPYGNPTLDFESGKKVIEHLEKMPSAQPDCSDCIKHGGDWDCDHVHCHKGESAQPEQRWISVTERLPEEHIGFYLVTVQKRRITALNVVGYDNTVHDIDIARWDYDRRAPQRGYHWCKADKVVAWMPLPKPWKGEEHDE